MTDNHSTLKQKNIAIVIPAHNEAATIAPIIEKSLLYTDNVIVVDDGSNDNTQKVIRHFPITILKNTTNLGKDQSLIKGLSFAQEKNIDAVITLDADGQHDPSDIPKLIKAMQQYPNHLIVGARLMNKKASPLMRRFANRNADFFISWAAGKKLVDTQSGFRLYPINLLKNCLSQVSGRGKFLLESEILIIASRHHFNTIAIPITACFPENLRPSHFSPLSDTGKIIAMVARKLISRGMCLPGLVKALFGKPTQYT